MVTLALVLVVVDQTGSYATAGIVTACFTLTAGISGPFRGRGVDRFGATPMLGFTGVGQTLALLGIVAGAAGPSPALLMAIAAAFAGLLIPPISPVMRVIWTRLLPNEQRDAGFAVESITVDLIFIVGPLIIALLLVISTATVMLILAAGLTALGSLGLAFSSAARSWRPRSGPAPHWLGAIREAGVRRLLPATFLVEGSLSAAELAIIAFATTRGDKSAAGYLIAVLSLGSVAGGLYWGSRRQPGTLPRQLTVLLAALGTGLALLTVMPSFVWLGLLLTATGLTLAPSITVEYSLMDAIAPSESTTEAFAWIGAVTNAGAAAAAAVAGPLVGTMHGSGGFLFAGGLALVGALYCALFVIGPQLARE